MLQVRNGLQPTKTHSPPPATHTDNSPSPPRIFWVTFKLNSFSTPSLLSWSDPNHNSKGTKVSRNMTLVMFNILECHSWASFIARNRTLLQELYLKQNMERFTRKTLGMSVGVLAASNSIRAMAFEARDHWRLWGLTEWREAGSLWWEMDRTQDRKSHSCDSPSYNRKRLIIGCHCSCHDWLPKAP